MSSLEEGMSGSAGDPRVLFVVNAALSTALAGAVVWGLDYLGVVAFAWTAVLSLAAVLAAVTHLVVR